MMDPFFTTYLLYQTTMEALEEATTQPIASNFFYI